MKLPLQCGLYSAILCLAASLQCYYYKGAPDLAQLQQVAKTCESHKTHCSATLITYSGILSDVVLVKGCSEGLESTCNKTHSTPLKHIEANQTVQCCDTELCNRDLVPGSGEGSKKWGIQCLACNGQASACGHHDLPSLRCDPSQTQCIQVSITTALTKETDQYMIKSCSNTILCPGLSAFSNGAKPVSYASNPQCCNTTQCNRGQFTVTEPGAENGLQCHSRSSSHTASTMRCQGEMTQCVDLIGDSPQDVVMSGCATPSFCQGLYPQFSITGWKSTVCCSESLCNHGNSITAETKTGP
ncbi:urokinase plasminogen activator surface receptor-like [Discoglossus pictus]